MPRSGLRNLSESTPLVGAVATPPFVPVTGEIGRLGVGYFLLGSSVEGMSRRWCGGRLRLPHCGRRVRKLRVETILWPLACQPDSRHVPVNRTQLEAPDTGHGELHRWGVGSPKHSSFLSSTTRESTFTRLRERPGNSSELRVG